MELQITGLAKTYANGVRALDDISLTIPTGLFGLLGPNGAGKSSLMRTLATLQDADRGSATLVGPRDGSIDLLREHDALRRVLGYLPQDFGVYPKVSAEDLLDHLARLKGLVDKAQRADAVAGLLRKTNLYDVRKKALGGYSGGMRQRFGIAQALLGAPRLVIVDEPTAGLDPEERTRFHNLLVEIGEEVIVLLSTHIVGDVADLCPNLAIMHRGRVLVSGTPQRLIAALQGRIWAASVGRGEVAALREQFQVISTRLYAGRTRVHVLADARPAPIFEPVEATLEDAYFAAIGSPTADTGAASSKADAVAVGTST